jgi:cytochrome c oxidase subunit IV
MTSDARTGDEPEIGVREYTRCLIALLVLSALALGVGFLHLGAFTIPVALALAALKAGLVATYFMHLIEQPPSYRIAALSGLVLLVILIAFVSADVIARR